MSAGAFTRTFYESDTGLIHPIRLQPETLAAVFDATDNDPPAGPTTSGISAQVTGSRRGLGLFARYVTIAFTATPPAGYLAGQSYRITVPDPTVFDAITPLSTATYLSTAAIVISKTAEQVR